jgi:hypothetical protein
MHQHVGIRSAQWKGVLSYSRTTDIHPAHWMCVWSYSRLWWPDPRVGMKGKRLLWNNHWMFQACELGLPLQA